MNDKPAFSSRRSTPPRASGSGARFSSDIEMPAARTPMEENPAEQNPPEEMIKFDGFQQVLELLQAADPTFRRSLLLRIAERNRMLAMSLMKKLNED